MTRAIRIHANGGPEALRLDDVALPMPAPGEALVRHTAIGVNFIDTYHRTGLYPMPLPSGIGLEAAGDLQRRAQRLLRARQVHERLVDRGHLHPRREVLQDGLDLVVGQPLGGGEGGEGGAGAEGRIPGNTAFSTFSAFPAPAVD